MTRIPGLRIQKQYQLLPWVKLNISKTGASLSIGPKDVHITTGTHGTYVYANVPGAGIYYRRKLENLIEEIKGEKDDGKDKATADPEEVLNPSLVDRLVKPPPEIHLLHGVRETWAGNPEAAIPHAERAADVADGAFLAGFLALERGDLETAHGYLARALTLHEELGDIFEKYELDFTVDLPVTNELAAKIGPTPRGVLLALSEISQHMGRPHEAIEYLQRLRELDPEDLVIRLSLAELYTEHYEGDRNILHQIVALAEGVRNESPVHANLMYYRARALRELGLYDGARDTLTRALRRKKDYPMELLHALRYERALIYELTGSKSRAHSEFEKLYAVAPGYADVAERLGL